MTLTSQQVVDAIFKKMDEMGLSEKNWIKTLEGSWDTVNRQLWECLVAFYLKDLGYPPERFGQTKKTKTNLDFGFSINEKPFYGECVCPSDGTNPDAFKPWAEDEYKNLSNGVSMAMRKVSVEAAANQSALRITGVFYDSKDKKGKVKSGKQSQATSFHKIKGVAPTIVFLNTGFMQGTGIPLSRIGSGCEIPSLSSTVSALYGTDGVPTNSIDKVTGQSCAVATQSEALKKVNVAGSINRMGFRDGSLNAISAVLNCFIHPLSACSEYLAGKEIKDIFHGKSELIVNASGADAVALDDIKIFPDKVRRVFSHRVGIVLAQEGEQQCFKVVPPTVPDEPVEASQSTLRQAQGERGLQIEKTLHDERESL
jgi:hypothetical protein